MDDNMNVTEQDKLEGDQLDSEQDIDVYDEDEDGVYSAEVEDDEDPYELSDEELAELADEEDDEPAEDDADDAAENSGESENESGEDDEDATTGENAETEDDGEDSGGQSGTPAPTGETAEPSGEQAEQGSEQQGAAVDYASMATADIAELGRLYPSLGITDLRQIDNPGRYGALREMGLSVEEAFLATNADRVHAHSSGTTVHRADGKAHIRGDMPAKGASATDGFTLSASQMRDARELFPGMSDKEIIALYKSVSK